MSTNSANRNIERPNMLICKQLGSSDSLLATNGDQFLCFVATRALPNLGSTTYENNKREIADN
jgi:hypothetical protein